MVTPLIGAPWFKKGTKYSCHCIVLSLKVEQWMYPKLSQNKMYQIDATLCNWLTLVLSLGFPYQEKATFTKSFSSRYIYADPSWFFVLGFGYSQQLFKISWRWRLLILVVNHPLFLIHLLHFSRQFKRTVAFCRM